MMEKNKLNDPQQELNEGGGRILILDAYFASRSNKPMSSIMAGDYVEEHKSTQEIIDDLSDMASMDELIVVAYMNAHDYSMTSTQDGKVKWAIWRNINFQF